MHVPALIRSFLWLAILPACGALVTFGAVTAEAKRPRQDSHVQPPRLFPQIALSNARIAFSHAGDIWIVSRNGGKASRLTSGAEDDTNPSFSPDGSKIAFSRAVEADADIYVLPVTGGAPVRLSFHPAAEVMRGWSPDGAAILFSSARSMGWQPRLYTVPVSGGPSGELPIPIAWNGVFLPDGRIVYAPREVIGRYATSWRGYRGGSMGALAVADLGTGAFRTVSTYAGNDRLPSWAGDRLLVASDRSGGIYNVFSLDLSSGRASQITRFTDSGIGALAASADGSAIYERDGGIFLLDPSTGISRRVPITLAADPTEMAEREVPAADYVDSAAVSASGDAAIATRGDILLIDAAGHASNLTASSAATDQAPAFSPDGRVLAYVSFDARGDALVLHTLGRAVSRRAIALPIGHGGYFEPRWSPDGRHIALTDFRAGLWLVDVVTGACRLLDTGTHVKDYSFGAAWSPDSQWLAYAKYLPNNNRALYLQHLADGTKYQLTMGEVDVGGPTFDGSGKRLYFLASGNAAVAEVPSTYPALLRPLILRRIEVAEIDLSQSKSGLRQVLSPAAFARTVSAMPFETRDYEAVSSLADGTLIASVKQWPATPGLGQPTQALFRLNPNAAQPTPIATDVDQFALSADGMKILLSSGNGWSVRPLPEATGGRTFTLDDVKLKVVPPEEWRQIYRESWQAMRDSFYDPAFHGQDVVALEKRYARYLSGITRRADLTALLYLALGNVSVSHIAFDGGDSGNPPPRPPTSGLLGADFVIDKGRFRFARIYAGSPFAAEPPTTGPLDRLNPPVMPGEYLLRINGVDATADRDLHAYLLGTAGHSTTLTIGDASDTGHVRTVSVQPLASDTALREAAWIEGNRAVVRLRSQDTLAYVYIPDYSARGLATFIREWTAAGDKDGVVIDQRYNPGGWVVDFFLDFVLHKPLGSYKFRDAADLSLPVISVRGPRVLLINERNGSASDTFAWLFKRAGIGPLVGHRTAGWGVGHVARVGLLDGGGVSLPLRGFFNPDGSWDIENHGVVPDIAVNSDSAGALKGEDSQLNAAIDSILDLRRKHPTPVPRHPEPLRYPPLGRP